MKRTTSQRRRGAWVLGIAALLLFWGVRAAFSVSADEDVEDLDAGLALPAFASSLNSSEGPSLATLNRLAFKPDPEDALDASAASEDEDAEPEAAPTWTENIDERTRSTDNGFQVTSHVVRSGESLGSIAARAGVSIATLQSYNRLRTTKVTPGQKIQVPNRNGVRVRVESGQTLWDIARLYHVRIPEIAQANDLGRSRELQAGNFLFLPGARPLPIRTARASGRTRPRQTLVEPTAAGRNWSWPSNEGRISSSFGYRRHPISGKIRFHRGIDIAAPKGSPVHAWKAGVVVFSGQRGGYGWAVDVLHENGIVTRYAHNSAVTVRSGKHVRAGEVIAKVGSTGHSTGPHIHFEVIRRGERVNPLKFLTRGGR